MAAKKQAEGAAVGRRGTTSTAAFSAAAAAPVSQSFPSERRAAWLARPAPTMLVVDKPVWHRASGKLCC